MMMIKMFTLASMVMLKTVIKRTAKTLITLITTLFIIKMQKNFLFLPWVNLYMIKSTYLHDPPPFNGPFFMTPPFSEAQKVVTLPLFPPPPPLHPANF